MPTQSKLENTWKEQKVVADDGSAQDWFGSAVAVCGDWAFIGAKNKTVGSNASQGVVYVFKKIQGTWVQTQKLTASDGQAVDQFGSTIAVSNGIVLIAAPFAKIGTNTWQGAVYVFTPSRSSPSSTAPWVQRKKLVAARGTAFLTFGTSLAMNAEYALIGAGGTYSAGQQIPRTVYVFRRDKATTAASENWTEKQLLENPRPQDPGNFFGGSLTLSKDLALIGARTSTINDNPGQGLAYVYARSGAGWKLTDTLMASDGAPRDNFGSSVALYENSALVGAQGVFTVGSSGGAVYQFQPSGSGWQQTQKFSATPGSALSLFGAAMSASNEGALLIGAYATNNYRGAAYLFNIRKDTWLQRKELLANDGVAGNVFGYYTALDGETILVGSYTAQVNDNLKQGAAYFYRIPKNLP
ncbi:hypothetical protein [Dokdonella sp.]|uniref:hypothetical protein n=1 Tax=Dokdonella sp. TaxID=2291710 RepID=UPI001B24B987|nr:hypothetical protein [Dokdonella sp.]MBO9662358.1 hypothetical protein [Dokdonella sp.]